LLYIIVCDIPKLGGRIGQVAYYYLLFLWDLVVLLLPWLLPPLHLLLFGLCLYYMLFFCKMVYAIHLLPIEMIVFLH